MAGERDNVLPSVHVLLSKAQSSTAERDLLPCDALRPTAQRDTVVCRAQSFRAERDPTLVSAARSSTAERGSLLHRALSSTEEMGGLPPISSLTQSSTVRRRDDPVPITMSSTGNMGKPVRKILPQAEFPSPVCLSSNIHLLLHSSSV